MVIISRPGDGEQAPRPAILYGYGGFNVSLTPAYSALTLTWVEAGGVYAILAGRAASSEEGEEWHRAGMREHKQNVFDDFAAAAAAPHPRRPLDHLRPAGRVRRVERRPAGRRGHHPCTRSGTAGGAVLRPAAGHDPVRAVRAGRDLERDEYGTAEDPVES